MRIKTVLFSLVIVLLGFNSSGAELSCPSTEAEFVSWYKGEMLKQPDPKKMSVEFLPVAEECERRLSTGATATTQACLKPLINFSNSFRSSFSTVFSDRKAVKSLVLPRAFAENSLASALDSDNTPQAEIDERLSKLSSQLPKGSHVFQFMSGTILRESFISILSSEKEDIYVHAHHGDAGNFLALRMNKKDDQGKKIDPPTGDFFTVNGKTLNATPVNDNRCISCHRTGTIAIVPKDGIFKSHTQGISDVEMKAWWDQNRVIRMDTSKIRYDHLGPTIGPEEVITPTRTLDFVKDCAKSEAPNLTDARAKVIRDNMDCAGCHGLDRHHVLRYPMHTWDFGFKVLDNLIINGHMPLGTSDKNSSGYMEPNERKALLACLKAEYFGGFTNKEFSQNNSKPGVLLKSLVNESECKAGAVSTPLQQQDPKGTR